MQKKPLLFFTALFVLALLMLVIYHVQTNPLSNIKQVNNEQTHNHDHGTDPVMAFYADNCATCHGAFGQGEGGNPSIKGTKLTVAQIKNVLKNGRGEMPAFPDLNDAQLTQLARLVKQF